MTTLKQIFDAKQWGGAEAALQLVAKELGHPLQVEGDKRGEFYLHMHGDGRVTVLPSVGHEVNVVSPVAYAKTPEDAYEILFNKIFHVPNYRGQPRPATRVLFRVETSNVRLVLE